MPRSLKLCLGLLLALLPALTVCAADGNRLAYLDENNPYYPHANFPKLTTPQWVGEEGVEAVVVFAIDDMRDTQKYEDYLRPILIRLKQIDGRAPVSIMTCNVDPRDEQIQKWLTEGLSIDVHTVDHPCPLLYGGDFAKAKSTVDRCIDLLGEIPGNKPVAFRMPCCDSLNTVSPRFYSEIFNGTSENGNYLQVSSSVFNVFTSDDPEIPRELVLEADGTERFKKYLPKNLKRGNNVHNTFVNTIENYPYPYVINNLCWEFPCVTPSDWSAQHFQGKNNDKTLADWKAALDITVKKQGVFNLVFHPHGWIRNDQVVNFIDYAVQKHGKKVKFLSFKEAVDRLNKNLLEGQPLRTAEGKDSGVRLIDLNDDGYLDVCRSVDKKVRLIGGGEGNGSSLLTRLWNAKTRQWEHLYSESPGMFTGYATTRGVATARFAVDARGIVHLSGPGHLESKTAIPGLVNGFVKSFRSQSREILFRQGQWDSSRRDYMKIELGATTTAIVIALNDRDSGTRFRDLDGDGVCEVIAARIDDDIDEYVFKPSRPIIARRSKANDKWEPLNFTLPKGTAIVTAEGQPAGLRFVDVNGDDRLDVVFSNHERYGIWLFKDMQTGWSTEVLSGKRGAKDPQQELPLLARPDGTDNGFFVHSGHLFWQNEDTAELPDLVDRRSFGWVLGGGEVE